jgi:hypothetical protein
VSGNLLGTDTLSLMVNGTVDLANGSFTANAAGIIIGPGPTNTGNHPGEVAPYAGNSALNYAALLIGNSTLGFFQVFPSSADFGLGNSSPSTTLTLTDRTLADIGFVSGLTNGTVLESRVSDINFGDNSGAFDISQAAEVPEPGTTTLLILFLGGMAVAHRRFAKKLG